MRYHLITVGKCRIPYLCEGIDSYRDRIGHYCPIHLETVRDEPVNKKRPEKDILKAEASRILKVIPEKSYVFALDRSGELFDSIGLARDVEQRLISNSVFTFIIGSALGLDRLVLNRADRLLSFSRLTFPHEMSILMLLEQLYRIQTLLKGEKYHK